jgi:hypothetical protein
MEEKEFISELQASKLLEVHQQTMKNWREKGLLDGIFIEKKYPTMSRISYDKSKLIEWKETFK